MPKWKGTKKNIPPYANHSKYILILIYGNKGTMLLYDKTMILHSSEPY